MENLWDRAEELLAAGKPFVLATIIRTRGSVPREVSSNASRPWFPPLAEGRSTPALNRRARPGSKLRTSRRRRYTNNDPRLAVPALGRSSVSARLDQRFYRCMTI